MSTSRSTRPGRVASWASRSFVSFHPAFAYYADRYHLDVAVAEGVGVTVGVLDPVGGQVETDTYDKLLRFDTDALEKVMKAPLLPSENGRPSSSDGSSPP